jgi:hypothetical protein
MAPKRRIKVVYRKLGREKIWGQAEDHIEMDERLMGKKHLEILIHEALHVCFPSLSEDDVVRAGVLMANTLWHEQYRRVDNSNYFALQDGKK